jgi:hypothetical protein
MAERVHHAVGWNLTKLRLAMILSRAQGTRRSARRLGTLAATKRQVDNRGRFWSGPPAMERIRVEGKERRRDA